MAIQFDFLPNEYHEVHLRRRRVPLLALVVLVTFCLGTGALVVQTQWNRHLWNRHQELSNAWEVTRTRVAQFQQQQAEREQARKKLAVLQPILVGYPRSWLLEAVLVNVPQDVVLDRVSVSLKEGTDSTMSEGPGLRGNAYNPESAGQDQLIAFQKAMQSAFIEISIDARTLSATAVQGFLIDLSRNPMFEEVTLRTVEGKLDESKDVETTRFELVLRAKHVPNASQFIHPQDLSRPTGKSQSELHHIANRDGSP